MPVAEAAGSNPRTDEDPMELLAVLANLFTALNSGSAALAA
ncbi:hypothetical protein [Nocardia yunnanensis]|nr:hypothetical protein [Nocardia yunnanensis]